MSDYFNQFEKATTGVKLNNLPIVAGTFKNAMLNYKYANMCGWYNDLVAAKSVKEIFDIFNVKFDIDKINQTFTPVIENIYTFAGIKDALKAIAPYMENGSIFAKDSYRYYTITFTDGVISDKVRKIVDDTTTTPTTTTPPTPPVKTSKPKKTTKKVEKKEAKKFEFTPTTSTPVTAKRDDNTYTVQELVRELLKQMDMGNGGKYVTIDADFLFQNEKYA